MTTIDDLIDTLNTHPRGQSLLINLHRTIEKKWVPPEKIKTACTDFLLTLTAGIAALPSTTELADRLGETFVAKGLWLDAPEPIPEIVNLVVACMPAIMLPLLALNPPPLSRYYR